jgi:UPF0271 protein
VKKTTIDFNSDIGEGLGFWTIGDGVDEEIMSSITTANIATGFHAGDPSIMQRMVRLAKQHGVGVGAHTAFRDLVGFGRRYLACSVTELVDELLYQLGALREIARFNGVPVTHLKPHGALYMAAAGDENISRAFVETLLQIDPELRLYCMGGSVTYRIAVELGLPAVREFYGDRDYDASGSIVFARHVGRLDPVRVAAKIVRACVEGRVQTVEGHDISIDFESVCIHSDTPGALELIRATKNALGDNQIEICRPPSRDPAAVA